MKKTKSNTGWSLNQGLAAQYAAQAGLDPDLAAAAGESSWDVLKALRDAADERDPSKRKKRVVQTKRRLSKADLGRHGALVKSIHARLASLEGEGPSINPETGLQEFAFRPGWPQRSQEIPVAPWLRKSPDYQQQKYDTPYSEPGPTSGPRTNAHWRLQWADNPNDASVGAKAIKAAEEIDARGGAFEEMEAIRGGLAERYLPLGTPANEPPFPPESYEDVKRYDQRLNEFGLQWDVDPTTLGNLEPAGKAEQKFWLDNKHLSGAANLLKERELIIDTNGSVARHPGRHHPNPISSAFQYLDFGIGRRKRNNILNAQTPGVGP